MSPEKPATLSAQALAARLRDFGLNTSAQISALMMSGVFATAAMAFADIVRTPEDRFIRLTLWVTLVLASVGVMMGQVMINLIAARPHMFVTVYQLLWGFLAAAGFACISIAAAGPDGWRVAYVTALGQYILVWISLLFWPALFDITYFEAELHPFLHALRARSSRRTWISMVSFPVTFAAAVIAWLAKETPNPWAWIILGINIGLILQASAILAQQFRLFSRFVDNIDQARAAADTRERDEAAPKVAAAPVMSPKD